MSNVQKKMLISRVDPFSFSPKEELRSLLICASYKAMQNLLEFPGSGQPAAPSCFLHTSPGTSHILQLQLHISCISGFSTFCQQSKARKQCVQAVYRRPGPGSLWGNQIMAVRDVYASKKKGTRIYVTEAMRLVAEAI